MAMVDDPLVAEGLRHVLAEGLVDGWLDVQPVRTTHLAGLRCVRSSAAMTG